MAKGEKGEKGDKGEQGIQGAAGANGSQGPVGTIGSQGPAGVTGAQGEQGEQGSQGEPGFINFGTCYTKEEVRAADVQQFKSVSAYCDDIQNEFMLNRGFVISSGGGSQITHRDEQLSVSNGVPTGTSIAFQAGSSGTNYGVTLTLV